MEAELREFVAAEAEVRVALVVAEEHVVARLMRLDQIVLEQQRFALGAGDGGFHPRHLRDHHRRARMVLGLLEVAGHALLEVARLADLAELPYRPAYREADDPVPVPSIIHWKVTHFAAIVGEREGYFQIKDPTFGQSLWVTRAAIESEASGYFLVPGEKTNSAWRSVSPEEAESIRGMVLPQTISRRKRHLRTIRRNRVVVPAVACAATTS